MVLSNEQLLTTLTGAAEITEENAELTYTTEQN
jgi:hypothetical protein